MHIDIKFHYLLIKVNITLLMDGLNSLQSKNVYCLVLVQTTTKPPICGVGHQIIKYIYIYC